jgi:hypothetical protein
MCGRYLNVCLNLSMLINKTFILMKTFPQLWSDDYLIEKKVLDVIALGDDIHKFKFRTLRAYFAVLYLKYGDSNALIHIHIWLLVG